MKKYLMVLGFGAGWCHFMTAGAWAAGFDCHDPQSKLAVVLRNHLQPTQGTRRIDSMSFGQWDRETFTERALFKNRYTDQQLEASPTLLGRALSDGVRYTAQLDTRTLENRATEISVYGVKFSQLKYLDVNVKFDHQRPIPPGTMTSANLSAFSPDAEVFTVKLKCIRQLEHPEAF